MDPTLKIGELSGSPQKVEVVYAGGTISSMTTEEGYREGGHAQDLIELLQEQSPGLELNVELGEKTYAYTGLSENLTADDQETIADEIGNSLGRDSHGVLVSHGTDSLEQTARLLDEKFGESVKESGKKIILTAANEDLDHPETDAWDNLEFALESFSADVPGGVYVAFHGKLISASEVVKMPYVNGVSTFVSKNSQEYADAVAQQQVAAEEMVTALDEVIEESGAAETYSYDVNVIRTDHQELLDYVDTHDVKAILLNLYHSGSANTITPGQSVVELVEKLRKEKGIVFFGVTETGEPTDLRKYETSVQLRKAGVVPLYHMLPGVAETKLQMLSDNEPSVLVAKMLRNRAGEIDESQIHEDDVLDLLELYR